MWHYESFPDNHSESACLALMSCGFASAVRNQLEVTLLINNQIEVTKFVTYIYFSVHVMIL